MRLKDIYNQKIKKHPKITDYYIQFLEKLNDIQREEIEDYKNKYDIRNILTHYIELKYKLKTFSTSYSKRNSKYYDDRTYFEYLDDSLDNSGYNKN